MDLNNKLWKVSSYLRGQLPASVAENIIRKLAFTYFIYKKVIGQPSGDLEETVNVLVDTFNTVEGVERMNVEQDPFVIQFFDHFGPFGNRKEFISALRSGFEDYVFFANDGSHKMDTMQISLILGDLTADELLELLNTPFKGSLREDSTPISVTDLVLCMADNCLNDKTRAMDMTCSSGAFLLEAAKKFAYVEGVEINKDNALIAKMRLFANFIHGEIRNENCFEDSWHHQSSPHKCDFVFSEFPWKMIVKDYRQKEIMMNCNANRFMLMPTSTTDYFFMSAMMNYLKEDGVAITIVPLSTLSNLSDSQVRKHMVDRGFVREVIALPSNIFGRTGIATAIVVLGLKPVDKVVLFDGSQYFKQENRTVNSIDVPALLSALNKAKENKTCYFGVEELKKHDYSFSPSHYLNKVENIIPNAAELVNASDIFTGWQVPSAKLESIHKTDGTGIQLLQMSNVENGVIASKLERYDIPENTVEKFKVQKGDVVISTKSLRVKSAVVDIDTTEPVIASGSIMVIRPKEKVLDPYYLVAYFESDLGKQALEMYQSGTVIPNLSINNVKKIPIPLLPYEEQVKIGNNYRDLRDLIISEKKRLKALEEKANSILDNLWDSKEGE